MIENKIPVSCPNVTPVPGELDASTKPDADASESLLTGSPGNAGPALSALNTSLTVKIGNGLVVDDAVSLISTM